MHRSNGRGPIHLAYSSEPKGTDGATSKLQTWIEEHGQLELFVSEKPDTMIFAQPDRLGFDGIVQIVAMGHARRIFDLREVPFISFGNETRESFLRVLRKNQVEYFNIFKLQHKLGKGMEDHSENEEEKYLSFECNEVKRVLKPMIECGPTVVFSDCAPREDKAIKRFLDLLSQAEITYSVVFANHA